MNPQPFHRKQYRRQSHESYHQPPGSGQSLGWFVEYQGGQKEEAGPRRRQEGAPEHRYVPEVVCDHLVRGAGGEMERPEAQGGGHGGPERPVLRGESP